MMIKSCLVLSLSLSAFTSPGGTAADKEPAPPDALSVSTIGSHGRTDTRKPATPLPPILPGLFAIATQRGGPGNPFLYLYAVNGGGGTDPAFTTVAQGISPYDTFTLRGSGSRDPHSTFIMTANGYSVFAPDGGGRATADAVVADLFGLPSGQYLPWAAFTFTLGMDGRYTIQTSNGNYVTAVGGGGQLTNALHTDATTARSWEKFRVLKCGDLGSGFTYAISIWDWALFAPRGGGKTEAAITLGDHSSPPSSSGTINPVVSYAEPARFTFLRQADGSYALRTADGFNYVTAVGGGGRPYASDANGVLHTDATQVQAWETFRIVDDGRCVYTIQTVGGGYLGLNPEAPFAIGTDIGNPDAVNDAKSAYAHFQLFMFDL